MRKILKLLILICSFGITNSQESESIQQNESLFIIPELSLGYNFDRNLNSLDGLHTSLFFTIGKHNVNSTQEWAARLKYPNTGISFLFSDFGSSTYGQAFSIQPIIEIDLNRSLHFIFGIGLSYMNTIYDRESNITNTNISSHFGGSFRFSGNYDLYKSEKIDWRLGLTFLHFSNGRIKTPNEGLNALMLGVNAKIKTKTNHAVIGKPQFNSTKQEFFEMRFGLGFNAISEQYNNTKLVYTLAPSYGKIINRTFKFGIGLFYRFYQHYYDYIINEEELIQTEYNHFTDNPTLFSSTFGLFGSFELLLGHFSIEVVGGINFFKPFYPIDYMLNQGEVSQNTDGEITFNYAELDTRYELERSISGRLGLKYYLISNNDTLKSNWFIGAHINSNLGRADFMELSFGYVHQFSLTNM